MSEPQDIRSSRTLALQILFLAGITFLIYANALRGPFVFDDWHVIPQNPAVHDLGNVPDFFRDPTTFSLLEANRDYRPVFLTAAAFAWWVGDGKTWPFHVTSVLLHAAVATLLLLILRRLLRWRRERETSESWVPLLGASIFAVHPVATESVSYVVQQSEGWAALFILAAFLLFLRAYTPPDRSVGGTKILLLTLSSASYFLALASKPVAVTLMANLVLFELVLPPDSRPAPVLSFARWRKYVPYAVVTLAYLGIRASLFQSPFASATPPRSTFVHYLTQTEALVFYYLGHAVLPVGLNVDLAYELTESVLDPRFLAAVSILAALAWALWRFRERRLIVFWALWFPVSIFITTYGVVLMQVVNDHRVYLSMVGFAAVVALLFERLWNAFPIRISDLHVGTVLGRRLVVGLSVAIVVLLGWATFQRNRVWASEFALWEDAALNGGTWRAHMNYALALEDVGRTNEALVEFRRAVELGPYAMAHLNLGHALVRRNRIDEGLSHLETAVRLWPELPEAHLFLGYGLQQAGRYEAAERAMRRAIQLRPNYIRAYTFLGELYEEGGETSKAIEAYRTLAEISPTAAWADERARALSAGGEDGGVDLALDEIRSGRYREAVAVLERGLRHSPEDVDVLFNLAYAYQMLDDRDRSIEAYERLLELDPDHRQGTFNLGYAYLQGDSREEATRAVELFQRELEIDPDYTEAIHRLATAHWALGDEAEGRRYDRLYLERGQHPDLRSRSRERLSSTSP